MQETPEQKTARITKEIEEERERRYKKMNEEFKVQRKIKKSEAKEHKKIKKEEKAEERKLLLHKIKMVLLKMFGLLFAGLKIFFFILL